MQDAGGEAGMQAASGDGGLLHIDRSGLTDAGMSGVLDYSNQNYWLCRPDIDKNECHDNIDATEVLADGGQQVVHETPAADPKFDCFYVYPTVDLTTDVNMTNYASIAAELDPLVSQAVRFNQVCEIYAPLYRQAALNVNALSSGGGGGSDAGGSSDAGGGMSLGSSISSSAPGKLALGDVRAAFQYYWQHLNNRTGTRRKFVLIGHSQGTAMLELMMSMDIDPDANADVRSQMISALLIGGNVMVQNGQEKGGTFQNIPLCTMPGQTGCVVAYSSFDVSAPPGSNALFGMAGNGTQVACTNPKDLAGNTGLYQGSYFPTSVTNQTFAIGFGDAGYTTPFVLYRNMFQGQCVNQGGFSYLQISVPTQAGDVRMPPGYASASAGALGFGLHLVDFNIPMDDLIATVTKQAAAAMP